MRVNHQAKKKRLISTHGYQKQLAHTKKKIVIRNQNSQNRKKKQRRTDYLLCDRKKERMHENQDIVDFYIQ